MQKYEILKSQLIQLGLKNMANNFYPEAQRSREKGLDYLDFLSEIVNQQMQEKLERSVNYRIRNAKYPMFKTIDEFDFSFQPELDKQKISDLFEFEFVHKKENIIFIGQPGVGKSHLSIALGIGACERRIRNIFYTASDLMKKLKLAKVSNQFPEFLERLTRYSIVIVDELGYIPFSEDEGNLFFQFVNRKYERSSIILSTNFNFGDWGNIFKDKVVASAIIDRLIHHSHTFKITGNSYRMKNQKLDTN